MKIFWLFIFLLAISAGCSSAKKKLSQHSCSCDKIGLDVAWADSNQVTCFLIPVARNAKDTTAGTYKLAAAVARAGKKTTEPPMLYLHGGPGIATLGNLPKYLKSATWKLIREQRDLVFFDYRGTGHSEPELCPGLQDSVMAYTQSHPSPEATAGYSVSLYKACREQLQAAGTDLATFTTAQLASDTEAIRKALRIPEWHIYGVSYGTNVALNMLRHFPGSIKSVVLDSPYPPNAPWSDYVRPFASSFAVLEKAVAADPDRAKIFSALRKDFTTAVNRLNKQPVMISQGKPGSGTEAGSQTMPYSGEAFAWSIWTALLKPKAIPLVPLAIREVAQGNDAVLQKWASLFSSPDAYGKFSEPQSHAILCFEDRPATAEAREEYLAKQYPEFSAFISGYPRELCDLWRPDTANPEIHAPVQSQVPVLILCGEYDPVCPPLFGEITARTLPNATLLVVPAASHAAVHTNTCTQNLMRDFFQQPGAKIPATCVKDQATIRFINSDLASTLAAYKK